MTGPRRVARQRDDGWSRALSPSVQAAADQRTPDGQLELKAQGSFSETP